MKKEHHILIVDDEVDFAKGLARLLASKFEDFEVSAVFSGEEALEYLERHQVLVMLTDLRMPAMNGLALLKQAQAMTPLVSSVMLTAHGAVDVAVEALKAGAYDFLTKPVEPGALVRTVSKALERSRLIVENLELKNRLKTKHNELVGQSPTVERLKQIIAAVAKAEYTVLIQGESGTGKEMIARMIHESSLRAGKPFISVNCPAIPDELLESELFGHVKGAFTGADKDRAGLFSSADGGTIHLDEIGDISSAMQTKILRCLQEGEVRPVGSNKSLKVDVRILASTNQDLPAKVADRTFRDDLYYRLNVLKVQAPPLRERSDDISLLARYFLLKVCSEMSIPEKELSPEVTAYLRCRDWPGNVRELQNYVRRLAVFSHGDLITMGTVNLLHHDSSTPADGAACELAPYKQAKNAAIDEFTLGYVEELMQRTQGNISEAARVSGLSRVALQKILHRYDVKANKFKNAD